MDICETIRDFIIVILSSYLTWGIAMLIVICLLGWIICLLYKHNKHLKVFHKQISNFQNASSKIEIEVKSIRFYTSIVAYVLLFACLLAVIHYISHTLPRLVECGKTQNLGVDYLGLIVAIFAIIVTLLVTWNIYSTIKAKEELRETKADIEKRFEGRIKKLETCCLRGKNQLKDVERKHNELEQNSDKRIRNLRANVLRLIGGAWSVNLIEFSKPALFRRMINSSINSMNEYMLNNEIEPANSVLSYILGNAERIKSVVSISKYDKDIIINRFKEISNYSDIDKAEDFIDFISSIPEPQ